MADRFLSIEGVTNVEKGKLESTDRLELKVSV